MTAEDGAPRPAKKSESVIEVVGGMGTRRRRHGARFWLLAVCGGVAVVAVTAAIALAIGLLTGGSLEDATSALEVAVIGLGPYVGLLVRVDRAKRDASVEDARSPSAADSRSSS